MENKQFFLNNKTHPFQVMQVLEKFRIAFPGNNDRPTSLDDDWLLMKELADLLE